LTSLIYNSSEIAAIPPGGSIPKACQAFPHDPPRFMREKRTPPPVPATPLLSSSPRTSRPFPVYRHRFLPPSVYVLVSAEPGVACRPERWVSSHLLLPFLAGNPCNLHDRRSFSCLVRMRNPPSPPIFFFFFFFFSSFFFFFFFFVPPRTCLLLFAETLLWWCARFMGDSSRRFFFAQPPFPDSGPTKPLFLLCGEVRPPTRTLKG